MLDNKTISAIAENEEPFYPDKSEMRWSFVLFATIFCGLSLLLFMAMHEPEGRGILLSMFFVTSGYVIYLVYYMWHAPKLYTDKAHTYLRIKSSIKNEIISLADIESYDYFNCYENPMKYPFLCLCVQLLLHNGRTVEFFAFMKGAQIIIDNKMSLLGITKKSRM